MSAGPVRTCVACRRARPQEELIRIAAGPDAGARIDLHRRLGGRGAYVCPRSSCVAQALRTGALVRGLKLDAPLPATLAAQLVEMTENESWKEGHGKAENP